MTWHHGIFFTALISSTVFAQSEPAPKTNEQDSGPELVKQCILNEAIAGAGEMTLAQLREKCSSLDESKQLTALDKRQAREEVSKENRNVITPHKRNYILPISYVSHPNNNSFAEYEDLTGEKNDESLDNLEAKYQLSIKVPIFDDFSDEDQAVFFAFTLQSYWQIYNKESSSPFRETNYEPEIFWVNYLDKEHVPWGDEMAVVLGLSHQSNGNSQPDSRSWNRIYANFLWEKDGYVFSFKPWYRISESRKETPLDPRGDDNPDIYKYMGYFEFSGAGFTHRPYF